MKTNLGEDDFTFVCLQTIRLPLNGFEYNSKRVITGCTSTTDSPSVSTSFNSFTMVSNMHFFKTCQTQDPRPNLALGSFLSGPQSNTLNVKWFYASSL